MSTRHPINPINRDSIAEHEGEEVLTGHAVRVGKLLLAAKDILHFLLLHGRLLEEALVQDILVGTGATLEPVDAEGMSRRRVCSRDREGIAAIGTDYSNETALVIRNGEIWMWVNQQVNGILNLVFS